MASRARPLSSRLSRCLPLAFAATAACIPTPGDFDVVQELEYGVRLGSCVCVRLDEHYNNDGIGSREDAPDGNFDIPDAENGDTFPPQGMPDGGELTITSCQGAAALELEVADSGPGFGEEVRQKLFEPFFSTKSGGTGLGLAIVYRIAEVHGGDVAAANCPEGGAAFTLRFPNGALEAAA